MTIASVILSAAKDLTPSHGMLRYAQHDGDLCIAIKRAWRGEEGLAKVFWLYGVAALTLVLCVATGGLWSLKYDNHGYAQSLRVIVLAAEFGFLIWLSVALWRCAGRAASPYLKKAARLYDVTVIFFLLWLVCSLTAANFTQALLGLNFPCDASYIGGDAEDVNISFVENMCSFRLLHRN